MKRKDYRKPAMKIVKLQHQTHLLAGSGEAGSPSGEAGVQNYYFNSYQEE
ncbi:MAG: hypothetical protein IJ200_02600 [Prevotella sp.]|nr:hypothetical protein [Prevotella sp.]